jgi:integrase
MTCRSRGGYRRGKYWYFKYKKDDGTWAEHATGSTNYQEGQSIHAAFLRDREAGRLPNERGKWTLEQATGRWLEDRKLRVAHGTYLSERSIARNLVRIFGGKITLLKLADIQSVRRYENTRMREGVNRKTVNNELLVLAGILRDANLWQRVAPFYKPLRVQRSDVGDALTRDEAFKLIQTAQSAGPGAVAPYAAVLAYSTGMRIREIKYLRRRSIHVDSPHQFLHVQRSTTKTDGGARYVALDKMACWAIRKLLARATMLGADEPDHFLLPTLREKHTRQSDGLYGGVGYDPTHPQSSWDKEWSKVRKTVGISHRRFHDLRHSYITRAAEAGVPLAVTQAQVGHLSSQMISHYTHICQAAIHQAADQIEKNSPELLALLDLPSIGVEDSTPDRSSLGIESFLQEERKL